MSRCRSCGSSIVWTKTTGGKLLPVDGDPEADWDTPVLDPAGTVRPTGSSVMGKNGSLPLVEVVAAGQASLDPTDRRWRPHWATCPDADSWRKPR